MNFCRYDTQDNYICNNQQPVLEHFTLASNPPTNFVGCYKDRSM